MVSGEELRNADGGSGLSSAETLKLSPNFLCGRVGGEVELRVSDGDGERLAFASRSSSSPTSSTSTSTSSSSSSSSSTSTSISVSRIVGRGDEGPRECDGEGLLVAGEPTRRPTPKDNRSVI